MRTIKQKDFGRDHWSTFAYIENVCVESNGIPNHDKMRVNPKLHPTLPGPTQSRTAFPIWQPDYATRLKGHNATRKRQVPGHDDWHCADDLKSAGLIHIEGTGIRPAFKMTDKGFVIASLLRIHKANGHDFADFDPAKAKAKYESGN